jgi:CRISPR-associated protein Cst2
MLLSDKKKEFREMSDQIYEVGFAGRIRIDAHSLNNEGSVGNVTEPRTIVLANGEKTDGISGEMLKHIHAEALWQLAKGKKSPLCSACGKLSPMKADANKQLKGMTVENALNNALDCSICDIHGFLVQDPTINRKSTVEFGWAIGLPNQFHRDIHVHTRVASGEKTHSNGNSVSEQMIYNRPTRSGTYAFISVFQPWRIGLNEINYTYAVNDDARKKRYNLVLDAYKAMMTRLEGAMTTTRLPHFEAMEGLIVVATTAMPVPLVSPLSEEYIEQIEAIAGTQNIHKFNSFASLLQEIDKLKDEIPYKLEVT